MSRYDFWQSTGGSVATKPSTASDHMSSAKRTFQTTPGVQQADSNFYCGTKVLNPGPGAYSVSDSSTTASRSTTFGKSTRLMTASNKLFDTHRDPHVETRTIDNTERRNLIKATLGNKLYRYTRIKEKKKEKGKLSALEQEELITLQGQIQQLKDALTASSQSIDRRAKTPAPKVTAFATHGYLPHEKPIKYDESPMFYRSAADWDFGTETRGSTIHMAAFGYPNDLQVDVENENMTDSRVMTGVERSRSRCRKTDFFGPNAGERSVSPNAFSHSPAAIPVGILKHHRSDDASDTHSTASSTVGALSQRWTAQSGHRRASNGSSPKSCTSRRVHMDSALSCSYVKGSHDSDEMSDISALTMHTREGKQPKFMNSSHAMNEFRRSKNGTAANTGNKKKQPLLLPRADFFPHIDNPAGNTSDAPLRIFTMSTDDDYASKCAKPQQSPLLKRLPLPINTSHPDFPMMSPIDPSVLR